MTLGATEAEAVGPAVQLGIGVDHTAWLFLILALSSAGGAWLDSAGGAWLDVSAMHTKWAHARLLIYLASIVLGDIVVALAESLILAAAGLLLIGAPMSPLLGLRSHAFDVDCPEDRSTGLTMSFAAQGAGFAMGAALLVVIARHGALLTAVSALAVSGIAVLVS